MEPVSVFAQLIDCTGSPVYVLPPKIKDECGVCGGDASSCTDCAGIPKGG